MLDWLREFSKSTEIALKRCGRDRRARRFLILLGVGGGYVLFALGGFVYVVLHSNGQTVTAATYLIGCAGAGAILVFLRRAHKRENDLLNFSITGRALSAHPAPSEVEGYLAGRIAILASLVARAASESQLRRHPGRK